MKYSKKDTRTNSSKDLRKSKRSTTKLVAVHRTVRNFTQQMQAILEKKNNGLKSLQRRKYSLALVVALIVLAAILFVPVEVEESVVVVQKKQTITQTETLSVAIRDNARDIPIRDSGAQADSTTQRTLPKFIADSVNEINSDTSTNNNTTVKEQQTIRKSRWASFRESWAQKKEERKSKKRESSKNVEVARKANSGKAVSSSVNKGVDTTKVAETSEDIDIDLNEDYYTLVAEAQSAPKQRASQEKVTVSETFEDYLEEVAHEAAKAVVFPHFYTATCDTLSSGKYKVHIAKRAVAGFERKLTEEKGTLIEKVRIPRSDSVALICTW